MGAAMLHHHVFIAAQNQETALGRTCSLNQNLSYSNVTTEYMKKTD